VRNVAELAEAIDAIAPQVLALTDAPGMSVAVGIEDDVAYARGFGTADLATGRPMDTDTVGPTGSDAKPYTGVAAMQLVEAGIVELDGPVNDHLGGLRIVNPHGERPITLRDLLTHRSGLGTTMGFWSLVPPPPLDEHLRRVFKDKRTDMYGGGLMPLWATPVGIHRQYANTGIALVGLLVQHANPDGVSFSEWVRRRIFEPLGMTSTCFPPAQTPEHVPAHIDERRSVGYATVGGLRLRLPPLHAADYPAGSALTTPSDHARFLLAIAGGGRGVLSGDAVDEMLTPQDPIGLAGANTGLVWNVFEHGTDDAYFGHGGEWMWGWHNVARTYRHHRVCVVVNVNQFDLGDQGSSDRPSHLAGRLIIDVVNAWVRGEDPRPRRDEAGARSHLVGLMVADRLGGRLGIGTPLTDEQVADIAAAVHPGPGVPWDPHAFVAAVREVGAVEGGLPAVADVWRSSIPTSMRDLLSRQLGVPGLAKTAELLEGLL